MTSSSYVEDLEVEARYQRERLALYRARVQSSRPTTVGQLRQRERECKWAEQRLSRAEQDLSS